MQAQADTFWNVRAREKAEDDALEVRVNQIERALNVVRRTNAVRNAPGFQDLIEAMRQLHVGSRHKLENDNTLTEAGLREQRGYTRALSDVIGLMSHDQAVDDLARQLEEAQNLQAEALRRRPKPKEDRK